ncbi:MAG: OsmC family protein [Betaproteobacteria bacterium]|nr:OsmC family protein [Betaproteobacteria bacterium]
MDAEELKALQTPLKARYKENPDAARWTLKAGGRLGTDRPTVRIETGHGRVEAGLHPATGGSGEEACSGDMLLEALAACAGVTLKAVATALGIDIRDGRVLAEGDLDFRGTLGVARDVPVGFSAIRLSFELDTDASEEQLATLLNLAERYCVIYQTLRQPPQIGISRQRA